MTLDPQEENTINVCTLCPYNKCGNCPFVYGQNLTYKPASGPSGIGSGNIMKKNGKWLLIGSVVIVGLIFIAKKK